MPQITNGFGTYYYGRADKQEDGSFITTEWRVMFYVPWLPVRSLRVKPVKQRTNGGMGYSERVSEFIAENVRLHIRQVFWIYFLIFMQIIVSLYILLISILREQAWITVLIVPVWWMGPSWLYAAV